MRLSEVKQKIQLEKIEYSQPRLRVIDLAAEEVMGGGCKTSSSTGAGGSACMLMICFNSTS